MSAFYIIAIFVKWFSLNGKKKKSWREKKKDECLCKLNTLRI